MKWLLKILVVLLLFQSCKSSKLDNNKNLITKINDTTNMVIGTVIIPYQIVKQMLTDNILADSIKGYTIESFVNENQTENDTIIGGYEIINESKNLNAELSSLLKTTFYETIGYTFRISNICLFKPEVAFQFFNPKKKTVVLFSFNCNKWKFIDNCTQVITDFAPKKLNIKALVKELFDIEIQSVKN